jgi:adenine-specific DNA-methyltransferase
MNYIGSKLSLLEFLDKSISKITGNNTNRVFCDLFAGTGAVGTYFKNRGYKIIANDIQYYSYVLNRHYVGNYTQLEIDGLSKILSDLKISNDKCGVVCEYLQNINGISGFVTNNYCPTNSENRMYYTIENGKKCDAIREQIEQWHNDSLINDNEYFYLLATLLEAIDKVANTASVYGAFLKKFKKSAQKILSLNPLPLYENDKEHEIYNKDVSKLITEIYPDILYLDPPYNSRQYAANYHVLETIARNDNPELKGKTGLRDWRKTQKSKYCLKSKVEGEFDFLVKNTSAKYIFLSYNNEGLMPLSMIRQIMSKYGEYGFFTQEYNRFKADSNRYNKADFTVEYLHYLVKSD